MQSTKEPTAVKSSPKVSPKVAPKLSPKIAAKASPKSAAKKSPPASSLKSSPKVPAAKVPAVKVPAPKRQVKGLFSDDELGSLGLCDALVEHLRLKMEIMKPTIIQKKGIPPMLEGKDVLVRSKTGTGKTLTYALPIVQDLQAQPERINRTDGTRALILVPTRELAVQVTDVLENVLRAFHWIVPGCIMGGEKKKSEKARLRKGVSVLVATPGRLLDHLRTTQCFMIGKLQWMVLDEADRLLDLGFDKDLQEILGHTCFRLLLPYD